jgi:hypothetical protein
MTWRRVTAFGVAEDELAVVLPPGHPLTRRTALDLADLADTHWLDAPDVGIPLDRLRALTGSTGFRAGLRYEGQDVLGVLALVAAGHGPALLPRPVAGPAGIPLAAPLPVHRTEVLFGALAPGGAARRPRPLKGFHRRPGPMDVDPAARLVWNRGGSHSGAREPMRRLRGAVMPKPKSRTRAVAAVVSTILLAASMVALWAGYAPAAGVCEVGYTVNQWTGGFTAQVHLTNDGAAVSSWRLSWTFGADQKVTSAWNASVAQTGTAVTATSLSYNGALAAGGSTDFGLQATNSGTNAVPTDFAFNGVSCSGDQSSPTPSPTTSAPPGTGCTGAAYCDGFEDQTGTTPSGAWQASYPDCQGTGTVAIDHSVAHSGGTSLRVDGGSSYCNHAFALNTTGITSVGSVKYVRMYVRHTTALPTGHVAFATMTDAADGGKHLRLGGQNQALQWNRESDDATLPAQSPAGVAQSVPLPVNQWSCLEYMVDGTTGSMSTWLDGTEVAGLHLDQTPTPDVDAQWLGRSGWRPQPTDLRLGWESYAGGTDTLWYDDIAVASTRIGC